MRTVADPTAGKRPKPALPSVFALGLAACSLAVGVLANVEPTTVLLRSVVALVVGSIVGKLFCAVSGAVSVSGDGEASSRPLDRVSEASTDPS